MYDVITVGSATLDAFAHTDRSELITFRGPDGNTDFLAYPAGSKLIIQKLMFTIGGGGTNTATCLSRLGLKTGFVGEVGPDENGKQILSYLKKEGVKFLGSVGKEMTGYSIVLDSIEHDRTILTYKGCNDTCVMRDLKPEKLKTRWFYFASMLGASLKMARKLAVQAEKQGSKICFNPSSYLVGLGLKNIKPILDRTDLLVFNKEEAQQLLYGEVSRRPKPIEHIILDAHLADIVVITDGNKGAWSYDGKHIYHAKPSPIKIVESTGAGDAFASTLLAGLIKKKTLEQSLRLAVTNAESVLLHHGAKNNLLRWRKLNERLRRYPIRIVKRKP